MNKWKFKGLSNKFKIKNKIKVSEITNFRHFFIKNYDKKHDQKYITFGKGYNNEI